MIQDEKFSNTTEVQIVTSKRDALSSRKNATHFKLAHCKIAVEIRTRTILVLPRDRAEERKNPEPFWISVLQRLRSPANRKKAELRSSRRHAAERCRTEPVPVSCYLVQRSKTVVRFRTGCKEGRDSVLVSGTIQNGLRAGALRARSSSCAAQQDGIPILSGI